MEEEVEVQQSITTQELTGMRGADVYDSSGDKIGTVEEIFYDEQTDQPEWIGIGTGFFGSKRVLVPVPGASFEGGQVRVPYAKDQVKNAPDVDSEEISQETEYQLASHYGLGYSEQRSDTGLPEGSAGTTEGRSTERDREGTMTRSEEELRVGKRETEAGRVRLRKWVETEPVTADVQLQRETVRVEREPIEQPVSGAEIGEEQIDVTLRSEEAVVDKQVVARERIGLEKEVEIDTQTVQDEVRKERVEIEGDDVDAMDRRV